MAFKKHTKFLALNVLCLGVLAGCGGGGYGNFLSGGSNSVGNDDYVYGEQGTPVDTFLTQLSGLGQQNSPSVASVKNDAVGDINAPVTKEDQVRFNQPGIVSEVCWLNEDGSECTSKVNAETKSKTDSGKGSETSTDKEGKPVTKDDKASKVDADKPTEPPYKPRIAIRDVNNLYMLLSSGSTIDYPGDLRDAGVDSIDLERTKEGLAPYGGEVDRVFNGVIGFQSVEGYPTNIYFRLPAAAGWHYQTFGYYFSTDEQQLIGRMRNLNVGYQSIGEVTKELPRDGVAVYRGISHGFYNNAQVTSHNIITADFGDRTLQYRTTGTAIQHTYEKIDSGNQVYHIIERAPWLNVTASASWNSKNYFSGTARAGSGLTGRIEGQFYGPRAREVGGVFGLSKKDGSAVYVGGFGAQRPKEKYDPDVVKNNNDKDSKSDSAGK